MSELYQAFQWSNANHFPAQVGQAQIDRLVAVGLCAVVEEIPQYCPITDAQLHNPARRIVSIHASRDQAQDEAAERAQADWEGCGDNGYVVYPREPRPWIAFPRDTDQECPF